MESSDNSDYGEDMLEMVEEEDLQFLKNAIHTKSYSILNKVKHVKGNTVAKRRKLENDDMLESIYEEQIDEPQNIKNLLPIKTKKGIITRTAFKTDITDTTADTASEIQNESDEKEDEYYLDTDADRFIPKSSVNLLARYTESLRNKKVHIGYLCSSLLANPEEKVINFQTLLKILDDEVVEASLSIKKLVVVSLLEVFKDIIPSYQIKQQNTEGVKLKKDTIKLNKYEEALIQYYKKYLQKLEKFVGVLIKKRGNTKKSSLEEIKLGEVSVHAMCDLLVAHPYFNFAPNIAQAVIPFLNHSESQIREIVSLACKSIFKEDKKEEITLKILQVINHYVKNKAHNVMPDILEVLLHLKIKEVDLDQEKENKNKQKKIMSHKQNVLTLSKKEKKRKKRLQELEKEMLETKAQENKQTKQKNLTEITKIVFGIYFRILKSSTNTKVLGVCLEGLAKFSHCINFDYYIDLINILNRLLNEEWLGYREQLHCIQTVFAILSDQGDNINLDPTRIYTCLYSHLLETHASKSYKNCPVLLKILYDVLIRKRKKITNKRTIGFTKRISTLSLQLQHNGSLGMLAIIKQILMSNKSIDILLDLDSTVGNGDYQAELNDPEYCNASSAALYELTILNRHYHPIVNKFSRHISNGAPSSGEGSLPIEYGKCSPEQLFDDFDMSMMAFNPSIKIPRKNQSKFKRKRIYFQDSSFKDYCDLIVKQSKCKMFS